MSCFPTLGDDVTMYLLGMVSLRDRSALMMTCKYMKQMTRKVISNEYPPGTMILVDATRIGAPDIAGCIKPPTIIVKVNTYDPVTDTFVITPSTKKLQFVKKAAHDARIAVHGGFGSIWIRYDKDCKDYFKDWRGSRRSKRYLGSMWTQ